MRNFTLKLKNVYYKIGEREILKNICFECKEGEIIGIIGPNGSGKTTFLKTINGINKIDKGTILLNERNIIEYKEKELAKKISFMNQNTNLGFDFPCIDIVVLGRYPYLERFQEYGKKDIEIAEKYMKMTNTLKFKDKSILELSGGERQRVLFAKVLTQESDIMLLDEPSASLDMMYEDELFKHLESMKSEHKTVMSVIHNLRIAVKYCTRLILMSNGEIVEDGEPEKVITEENLNKVYGINARVYHNSISGLLDFCIL
ncbi:ABC transporter ATP-binding protein [Fusobacterium varium]